MVRRWSRRFSPSHAEAEIRRLNEALQRRAEELERRVEERTAELNQARQRAESADRLKSAFLAAMSHELRTPLNSILGFTGILLQGLPGPLNPEQRKQLEMVRNSSRHLLSLINDVLDLSKIEAGELKVAHTPVDISEVVQRAVESVRPQAEDKGLELQAEIASDLGSMVSDPRRIGQILLNLLGNAVKFTDAGSVTVKAERIDPGTAAKDTAVAPQPLLRISVKDTGPGIKPEDIDGVFQPFVQVDSGLTRRHEGTGLGLAISRRLAQLLGGELCAESRWGEGSTFTLTLPLKSGAEE